MLRAVRDLEPGAFAFVMATGVVSSGLRQAAPPVSTALLVVAVVGYVVLVVALAWRVVRFRRRVLLDALGPRAFAFLTFPAATNVLATRFAMGGWWGAAAALLAVGTASWVLLDYGLPLGLITHPGRRPDLGKVNGTWFMWVVATQSVAVAAATLGAGIRSDALVTGAAVCWAIGLVLYPLLAALLLARLLVRPVMPAELTPPYWVFMGSAAITVLAGALLPANPLVGRVTEVSAVLWAFCAWLVPMLLALGVWRHVLRGVPLRFRTDLWAMVFPIGMYGLASIRLGTATGTRWMTAFGSAVGWVAFAVWLVVFAAMVAKRLSTNAVAQRSPR